MPIHSSARQVSVSGVELLEPRAMFSTAAVVPDASITSSGPLRLVTAYVSGSEWTESFKQYLGDNVYGPSAKFGWSVYGGFPMTPPLLPWVNINRVTAEFNFEARADADDLRLRGVNVPSYAVASVEHGTDPVDGMRTVTWTLARPLGPDRLVLQVDGGPDGVKGPNGGLLDGDGDGIEGGDFELRLTSLPTVSAGAYRISYLDVKPVRAALGTSVSNPFIGTAFYSPMLDHNADGRINGIDLALNRARIGTRLPLTQPSIASISSMTASLRTRPLARGLFSNDPILA